MLNILYEDNHIIVLVKEAGIPSQGGMDGIVDLTILVKEYLKEKYNKPGNVYLGLVHRLDINTKGIMVLAKTSKASERLTNEIKNNEFNKCYLALVEGSLKEKHGTLINYLEKDEKIRKAYVSSNGKEAILEYDVVEEIKKDNQIFSILDIKLKTGRFHQIRCQMSHIGHPIYGDVKYGSKFSLGNVTLLYAYNLKFIHPVKKEEMDFKIEVLDEIKNSIRWCPCIKEYMWC